MKKVLFIASIIFIAISCKSGGEKTGTESPEVVAVSLDEMMASPSDYVDKMVSFSGLVDHVCREGGKKMFLVGENPENRIRVNTGEDMASFDVALEGNNLNVTGIFTELRIDEDYLSRWETELASGTKEQAEEMKVHTGEGQGTHAESTMGQEADQGMHVADMEMINRYREMLTEQNTDHLSFYSVLCKEYKPSEQ